MTGAAEHLYDLDASRTPEQREYMAKLEADGICIFCEEHVAEYQSEPIEFRGTHWFVTKNAYPYEGASAHYLIVALRHVRSFDELGDEAGAELWSLKRMLKTQLRAATVATVERSGDMRYNGGSVAHLHVHFVALPRRPTTTVRFRVSAHAPTDAEPPSKG